MNDQAQTAKAVQTPPSLSASDAYLASLDPLELEVPEDLVIPVIPKGPQSGPGRKKVPIVEYVSPSVGEAARCNPAAQRPLFNNVETTKLSSTVVRKQEKNSDRIIGMLHAQGYSGVQIADHLQISKATVYNVLQLPWVRELVREEIAKYGVDAVHQQLSASLLDNIGFLQDTVHNSDVQTRDRIAAAKELIDRTLGKAQQTITHKQDMDLEKLSDEALMEIATRGGSNVTVVQRDRV